MNDSQKKQIQELLAASSPDKIAEHDNELAILHQYGDVTAGELDLLLKLALEYTAPVSGEFGETVPAEPVMVSEASQLLSGLPVQTWTEFATSDLERRNIETKNLTLSQFFTAQQIEALEHRIQSEIDLRPDREPWRGWEDYVVVCMAGMLAGVWELLVKKINVMGLGLSSKQLRKRGEAVKDTGREWLERFFGQEIDGKRVVLDAARREMNDPMMRHVMDRRIPKQLLGRFGQDLHRGVGPMHDLCRIRETVGMMMSDNPDFKLIGVKGPDAARFNVFAEPGAALVAVLFHLMSDLVTKRSPPLPGITWVVDWSPEWRDRVQSLYARGVNVKNVFGGAAELSTPVITDAILRLYFAATYADGSTQLERFLAGGLRVQTRREREMLIVAHGIAAAVGSLRFVLTQNLLDLNLVAVLAMLPHAIGLLCEVQRASAERLTLALTASSRLMTEVDAVLDESLSPIDWMAEAEIDRALGLIGGKSGGLCGPGW